MEMSISPWVEKLFRPLVIGAMIGCIALSMVGLVRLFAPDWSGTILVAGCVLAALEASYSYRLVRAQQLRPVQILRFRAAEIAMFFILLKIAGYIDGGWADAWMDVQTWPRQPANILDPQTTTVFLLALFSWWAATQTMRDLERLSEPLEVRRYYASPRDSLARRFFWGGALLLLISGLHRVGIAQLLNLRRPSVPGLVLNVLVYFLLGLVMLGQVQFTRLRQQWQGQKIKVASELPGRWVRYSLAFIGLAALVAFLLPTGYTMGLLDSVGGTLLLVGKAFWFLLQLAFFLISLPAWLLLYLLFLLLGQPLPRRRLPPLRVAPRQPGDLAGGAYGWLEVLRSLFFWAITFGMVFYVIRSYLRDHPADWRALASLGLVRALRRFLIALWRRLVGWAEIVNERLPRRWSLRREHRGLLEEPFHFFRLGALSPRERILYYYLSILRRAGRQGFPRRWSQTPSEYDAALGPRLPEARQEMAMLTRVFLRARYSLHAFDREQAGLVRVVWQQVKAALRELKRDEGSPEKGTA
jgi:hypothetical protein